MKVAILGAGAVGFPLGYMLRENDANEVVYLVRENKVEPMESRSFKLFSYDQKKIITHENINCLPTEPLLEVFDEEMENPYAEFDILFSTLPTHILASDTGKAMFKGLGQRLKSDCAIISLSPGFMMQEIVFDPAGIDAKRIGYGLPNFLSHEVEKSHELENDQFPQVSEADFAFHYLMSSKVILLMGSKPKPFKETLGCASKYSMGLGEATLELSTAMFLILNLVLTVQNFPKSLQKDDPSFSAGVKAFAQISNHYGVLGTMMRWTMGKNMFILVDKSNRLQSKPLTVEFLRYHHGHKVFEQNVGVIEAYIAAGKEKSYETDQIELFVDYCREFSVTAKQI